MQTATNPETGEKLMLVNNEWVPVQKTATNPQTGAKAALIGGEWVEQDAGGTDFSIGEMVSNIPSSAMNLVGDMKNAVMNPVDTAKGVGALAGEVLTGQYANEIGRAVTGAEPSQSVSGVVHQGTKDRYGTADAAKETLMTDPVGVLTDAAGMGGGAVPKVTRALEPISAVGTTVRNTAKVATPESLPGKLYQRSAKLSTTLPEAERMAIIQTALDKGIMPTAKGVAKVKDRIDVLDHQLTGLIEDAGKAGATVPVNAVFVHLKDLRKTKGGVKIEGAKDLAFIDSTAKKFMEFVGDRKTITVEELQKFKQDIYTKAYRTSAKRKPNTIKEDTYRTIGRGAKDAVESRVPEAGAINKELSEFYELEPHLTRAAGRIENRNPIGLTTPINVAGGGVIGQMAGSGLAGVAAGTVAAVLNNPKMKARLAIALNRIKQGDTAWINANKGAAEVRVALALSGRLEEELNQPASQ